MFLYVGDMTTTNSNPQPIGFDLFDGVLASLDPIVETSPTKLTAWADNLDRVADAYDARGQSRLAAQKRARADHLRAHAKIKAATA